MKRHLSVVFLGLAIIATGAFVALNQTASSEPANGIRAVDSQDPQSLAGQSASRRALAVERVNRDGTRILSFRHTTATALELAELTAQDEVNVTSLTIENGIFATGAANNGGMAIRVGGLFHFFAFEGYGTFHYTFPTPIPVRQGDQIQVNIPGGNVGAWTQVYLIGTPPTAASDEIVVF